MGSTGSDIPTYHAICTSTKGMEWPNYSPDGCKILFNLGNQLFIVEAQPDSTPDPFLPGSSIPTQTRSAWSSLPETAGWIAFTTPTGSDTADTYVISPAGGSSPLKLDIRGMKSPNNPYYPSWYPFENQLLVTRYGKKLSDGGILYRVSFDPVSGDAEASAISGLDGYFAGMASVSPDGAKMAIAGESSAGGVYNQNTNTVLVWENLVDGVPPTVKHLLPQVTVNGKTDYMYGRAPRWSPDGRCIVFRSNYNQATSSYQNEYIIYHMPSNAYGATPTPLSDPSLSAGHPTYSPDGKRIAFSLNGEGERRLGYIDVPDCATPAG